MKNLIIIIATLAITFSAAFANTTPETLISTDKVEVISVDNLGFFADANYDEVSDNLIFNTVESISVVQIFNAKGDLIFQLPVMSKKVNIDKSLFSDGKCNLGFILEGQTDLRFTQVTIK